LPDPLADYLAYRGMVASFLVFRDLPGVTRDQYAAAQRALADAARRSAADGLDVAYLGGFFLPATARAVCVFRASSAAAAAEVNRLAGVPVSEIAEAIDLTSDR
jgi:Protein of unknown function (DUF4242)